MNNFQTWIKGLIAAIIGGAANAVTTVIVAPDTFNLHDGLGKLATVAGASALVSAAMYLKQSPVPPSSPAPAQEPPKVVDAAK